jgi:hypothetical protein
MDVNNDKALALKSKIRYTGFIAQEVETAVETLDFDFSGVVAPTSDADHYSLRYAEFVVPLVKATQEQQNYITELEEEVTILKEEMDALKATVTSLAHAATETTISTVALTNASLLQNQPNPFNGMTTINYTILEGSQQSQLRITDANGIMIRAIDIEATGFHA